VLFTRDYWRMKTLELQNQNTIDKKTQQFLLGKISENTLEAHQMVNDLIKMIEEKEKKSLK